MSHALSFDPADGWSDKMTDRSLGVVVVTFNSADVILDCLETLLAAAGQTPLCVVVVDNGSNDDTVRLIGEWASGQQAYVVPDDLPFVHRVVSKPIAIMQTDDPQTADPNAQLSLIVTGQNGGFAGGVNVGLAYLARNPKIARFWVLNPDGLVPQGTPDAFALADVGPFSLMGGRVTYMDPPDRIQMDGGTINARTGVTGNLNLGRSILEAAPPKAVDMAFITGASLVASRAFYEAAGPMPEEYFLYYEEVDWAMRRGSLPLAFCAQARIYHRAGTSIGSATLDRLASPFSLYFKHRARMRFVSRYLKSSLVLAWAYTLAKAGQYVLKGHWAGARAMVLGAYDGDMPAEIRNQLGQDAARLAARRAPATKP
jgi:GT2 family glycosyltransferase